MKTDAKHQPGILVRYLPILKWLPKYQRAWLRTDLIAGLTVVALLVPEGMAISGGSACTRSSSTCRKRSLPH